MTCIFFMAFKTHSLQQTPLHTAQDPPPSTVVYLILSAAVTFLLVCIVLLLLFIFSYFLAVFFSFYSFDLLKQL